MGRPDELSAAQARRIALGATGLFDRRPAGAVDRRHLRKVLDRLHLLQIDSVNVCVRAQYMPLFSRLGAYDRSKLDAMAYRYFELFEYWAHEASMVRSDLHPLLRWRMQHDHAWKGVQRFAKDNADLLDRLRDEIAENGPLSAGDLDDETRRTSPWWGWSDTKRAVEYLFHCGDVGAIRRPTFERAYCAPAHCLPPGTLDRPGLPEQEAKAELLVLAARAHGVGTAKDLADYFRMPVGAAKRLLPQLAGDGRLREVRVEGWKQPAYRHPDAVLPRRADACAIVSPFDQVMWERDRVERVHGFRYRIEIYVPKPKRTHGYYVYPFILGDRFVGRVDLKADRQAGVLRVQSAWQEPGVDDAEVAIRLLAELRTMAAWLGLDEVAVTDRGDLAPALRAVR